MTTTVPFTAKCFLGFGRVSGGIRLDERDLSVEFEVTDSMLGLVRLPFSVRIPLKEVERVEYKDGFFGGGRLRVHVTSIFAVQRIFWREGTEFEVAVKSANEAAAKQLVEEAFWLVDDGGPRD